MSTDPRVSIVMPVYDSERFLADALGSIAAQTYRSFEVVVVDGPSTDATERIARSFAGTRYLRQTGTGMWNALNEGVRAARGALVCFLSDDDLWLPDKLRLQVALLDRDDALQCVGGGVRFVEVEGDPAPAAFRRELLDCDRIGYMPEVIMVRRAVFDALGGFDESHRLSGDTEWLSRMRDAGLRFGAVPEVVLHKRVHGGNLSTSDAGALRGELLRIVRDKLARRRHA